MIGLGISTTLWLVVKGAKNLMFLIDTAFRSLSRSEWPDEYLIPLRWVLNEFKNLGFRIIAHIDEGGDNPGVILKKDGAASKIEVRLNAPLFSQKKYAIVVINQTNQTGIVMISTESEENKKLLGKYIELLS